MNNKDLLEEIAKHTTILDYHIRRLEKRPGQVHNIDKDLLAEKVKELYELVHQLLPEEKSPDTAPVPEEKDPVPRPPSPEPAESVESGVEPSGPEEKSPDTAPVPEEKDPVPRPPSPEPPKTTADLFSGTTTIADAYQSEEDNSIAARVNPQPLQDLKKAIGINDKFLFINELFNGDPAAYNQVIEKLNASNDVDAAGGILEDCRTQYSWSDKSEAYHRLKKIVKTKYSG